MSDRVDETAVRNVDIETREYLFHGVLLKEELRLIVEYKLHVLSLDFFVDDRIKRSKSESTVRWLHLNANVAIA